MQDPLELTITGRVMLVLSHLGLMNARRLAILAAAVRDAVRCQREADSDTSLEALIDPQIGLLERSLKHYATSTTDVSPESFAAVSTAAAHDAGAKADESPKVPRPKRHAGHPASVALSMEEKLREGREPVQKLMTEDCVAAGLIDPEKARSLIAGMTGKQPEDAELEIVEYLREVLLQQVKTFIRKNQGGPWSAPRVQADLRNDIHHALTVRGILTLSRQINKERRVWEKANGRGGILGLFAGRH